jgi:Asp-tRNA(Asn)/Glu-tRNA(Gln) amidotransferase A subunit family amidase
MMSTENQEALSMTEDVNLCYLSATEALALFAKRKLKPSVLLAALQARSAKINPLINCFADQYWNEAMVAAKHADGLYARRGAWLADFQGVD